MISIIQINDKELLLVKVPEGADDFELEIFSEDDFYRFNYILPNEDEESGFYGNPEQHDIDIPVGSWLLLGKGSDFSEEVAKVIVDEPTKDEFGLWMPYYNDYTFHPKTCPTALTALESLHSLIKREGHEPNNCVILIKQ